MSPTPGLGLVYPHPHLSPQKFVPGPHLFAKKFQSQIQNQLLILLSLFLVSLMLSFSVIKRRPLLEMQSSIHFYALYIIIGGGEESTAILTESDTYNRYAGECNPDVDFICRRNPCVYVLTAGVLERVIQVCVLHLQVYRRV